MNLKREFSSDYNTIDEWKYVIEYYTDVTIIKLLEKEKDKWVEKQSFDISACCDELLFKTISKDFENGEVKLIRQ